MSRSRTQKVGSSVPAASPVFDVATRYAADTTDVVILDPVAIGKQVDTGARITIRSVYSKEAREAAAAARARFSEGAAATEADVDASLLEQAIACTVSWRGFVVDGQPLACTPENVRALYTDPRTAWVGRQVVAAYLDLGRFFGTPKAA